MIIKQFIAFSFIIEQRSINYGYGRLLAEVCFYPMNPSLICLNTTLHDWFIDKEAPSAANGATGPG